MAQEKCGECAGLADRLDGWIQRLSRDKTLPWMGLGLVADLTAARDALAGRPTIVEPEEWEKALSTEYDL